MPAALQLQSSPVLLPPSSCLPSRHLGPALLRRTCPRRRQRGEVDLAGRLAQLAAHARPGSEDGKEDLRGWVGGWWWVVVVWAGRRHRERPPPKLPSTDRGNKRGKNPSPPLPPPTKSQSISPIPPPHAHTPGASRYPHPPPPRPLSR
jgi:hypothetical protein